MKTIDELLTNLHRDTKIVASARFNKVKRLKRQNFLSLFSITFMSITLILISLYEKIIPLDSIPDLFNSIPNWFINITLSIIILTISIAISTARLDFKIDKLHDSAIKINRISRIIESHLCNQQSNLDDYKKLLNKYDNIIKKNMLNHDEIDYFIAKHTVNKKKPDIKYFYFKNIKQLYPLVPYYLILLISLVIISSITINLITYD